jgi:hypothetical protein
LSGNVLDFVSEWLSLEVRIHRCVIHSAAIDLWLELYPFLSGFGISNESVYLVDVIHGSLGYILGVKFAQVKC